DDEEKQPFDRYGTDVAPRAFVLGHFQIDPDGSVHPLPFHAPPTGQDAEEMVNTVGAYWRAARRNAAAPSSRDTQVPGTTLPLDEERRAGVARLQDSQDLAVADDKRAV